MVTFQSANGPASFQWNAEDSSVWLYCRKQVGWARTKSVLSFHGFISPPLLRRVAYSSPNWVSRRKRSAESIEPQTAILTPRRRWRHAEVSPLRTGWREGRSSKIPRWLPSSMNSKVFWSRGSWPFLPFLPFAGRVPVCFLRGKFGLVSLVGLWGRRR